MADCTSFVSSAPKESENYICKHCSKKVVSKVKCADVFHPACFRQSSEQKKAICKHEPDQGTCDIDSHGKTRLSEENKLLKQMLADKNMIINDKEQLIQLLYEKIVWLETQINPINNRKKEKPQKNHNK